MTAPSQAIPGGRAEMRQVLASLPVVIPRVEEVAAYLEGHQDLLDLVLLACQHAHSEFGGQAELSLELYRDPEIADQYLTLYVRQQVYDRHVMARIEDVRARYRDELSSRKSWFHVTTGFRPPGVKRGL